MSETESAFDRLSDVLHAVRLTGAVFYDFHATSPFAAEAPASRTLAPHVMRRSASRPATSSPSPKVTRT